MNVYENTNYQVALLDSTLSPYDESSVNRYMVGSFHPKRKLQEGRSVAFRADKPSGEFDELKIKGCGLIGGQVKFGKFRTTGPECPFFDFDGRYGIDISKGHDRAFEGGMSFQQAVVEHRVANFLVNSGYNTAPSAAYGFVLDRPRLKRSKRGEIQQNKLCKRGV